MTGARVATRIAKGSCRVVRLVPVGGMEIAAQRLLIVHWRILDK